jgi:cephalosporin hydroxylase
MLVLACVFPLSLDPIWPWPQLARNSVKSGSGELSVDDVTFGFDQLYEHNKLWAQQRFMGVQCQQDPMDAWILQEILFDCRPDLVIETGTQNGGGTLFYAAMMQLYDPTARVLTVDTLPVDSTKGMYSIPGFCARKGCLNATDNPLWSKHVQFILGRSTDLHVLKAVREAASKAKRVMVVLDSLHRYDNVLNELQSYHDIVTPGQYLIIQDTKLDRIRGTKSAKAAAHAFMQPGALGDGKFRLDKSREYLLYSQHSDGYLLRV